jgi:FO synthase
MAMKIAAVVPVKRIDAAKQRLAHVLAPELRAALALAMLRDVLDALARVRYPVVPAKAGTQGNGTSLPLDPRLRGGDEERLRVIVATADPEAEAIARAYGAAISHAAADESHSAAVAAVARALAAEQTAMLTLPADVPLIEPEDIARLIALAPGFAIVPARDGLGSNAMLLAPADAVPLTFGGASFPRHMAAARARGIEPRSIALPRIALDIDTEDDLAAFMAIPSKTHARAVFESAAASRLHQNPPSIVMAGLVPAIHALSQRKSNPWMPGTRPGMTRRVGSAKREVEGRTLASLMEEAAALRDQGHGDVVSHSRKVFIPLTQLCRDSCHYCTFAHPPRAGEGAYLSPEAVLAIARAGAEAGCREALFTLGDKPELRYRAARDALAALGHETTLSYLAAMAALVLKETGLLPHINAGVMGADDILRLRDVSVSQGLMLETAAPRLLRRGGPHFGSPDKDPAARLQTIAAAGEARVPFTSGILIGIGETREERIEALLALRALHERYGHLQEIIIQNFRAKPGTRMADAPEPALEEHLWTIAVARILFGAAMTIQAPPNLAAGALRRLIDAGINDWGGVSPVTPDHVNPERPWPALDQLQRETEAAGKVLVERLAIYPAYAREPRRWLAPAIVPHVLRAVEADGFARDGRWMPGAGIDPPEEAGTRLLRRFAPRNDNDLSLRAQRSNLVRPILDRAMRGERLSEGEIAALFAARGGDFAAVCEAADALRREVAGDRVTYVVTRNINYTNICTYRCRFCAFSKGKLSENLRGRPYDLALEEIARRSVEAWERGGVEVCLQGGIHPDYTGATYLAVCRAIKAAVPEMHIHAFSPLEVFSGARTLGSSVAAFLAELKAAGLGSLPGTAAEILDDEVRAVICPDKVTTEEWLDVIAAAHGVGLSTTATIMFGHVDEYRHWARHLLRLRDLQARTQGFTEFVPLPFVPMETPLHFKGQCRLGPTFREAVLMHAVARLALHPHFKNIQTSWVKMGPKGAALCLEAGANDLGGTLMNESITRAAGAVYGQEMPPEAMDAAIRGLGRTPMQRTTLYGAAPAARVSASYGAPPLSV